MRKVTLRTCFLAVRKCGAGCCLEPCKLGVLKKHSYTPIPTKGMPCTVPEAERRWPGVGLISPSTCTVLTSLLLLPSSVPSPSFLPLSSLCACVCVHVHVHGHLHAIAHMWRSEDNFIGWPSASTLFEEGYLVHQGIRQDSLPHQLSGSLCLLPLAVEELGLYMPTAMSGFLWSLDIWSQLTSVFPLSPYENHFSCTIAETNLFL